MPTVQDSSTCNPAYEVQMDVPDAPVAPTTIVRDRSLTSAQRTERQHAISAFSVAAATFSVVMSAYDIFTNYNLAFGTFLHDSDLNYFCWSLTFSLLTEMGFWWMGLRGRSIFVDAHKQDNFVNSDDLSASAQVGRVAMRIPIIASLVVPLYEPTAALWGIVCNTFPQYIITVSHALETRSLGTRSILSLSASLIMLMVSPIHMMAKDDVWPEMQRASLTRFRQLISAYHGWVRRRFLVLGPVIFIEVIHFMPVLIERYYYGGLTRSSYISYLFWFNVPKLLFLLQRRGEMRREERFRFSHQSSTFGNFVMVPETFQFYLTWFFAGFMFAIPVVLLMFLSFVPYCSFAMSDYVLSVVFVLTVTFAFRVMGLADSEHLFLFDHKGWIPVLVVMPLIPCTMIIESGRKADVHGHRRANYHTHLLVVYMCVSYGNMFGLLSSSSGTWTNVSLSLCLILLVIIAVTWLWYYQTIESLTMAGSSILDKIDSSSNAGWQRRTRRAQQMHMHALDVSSCAMTFRAARLLCDELPVLSSLTSLNLSDNNIGPHGAKLLVEWLPKSGIKVFDLCYSDLVEMSSSTANAVLQHPKMESFCHIPVAQLRAGATLELDLGMKGIGAHGVLVLANLTTTNTTLTALDISGSAVCGDTRASVRVVSGPGNHVKRGAVMVHNGRQCTVVSEGRGLSRWLSGEAFVTFDEATGNVGIIALSEALKVNRVLTSLSLRNNDVGDEEMCIICDAIKCNRALKELDVSNDSNARQVGVVGAQAIADMLKVNRTLSSLNLAGNRIGSLGGWTSGLRPVPHGGYVPDASVQAWSVDGHTFLEQDLKIVGHDGLRMGATKRYAREPPRRGHYAREDAERERSHGASDGIKALVESLKVNKTLRCLNLLQNSMEAGAISIVAAAETNSCLKALCGTQPEQAEIAFAQCGLISTDISMLAYDLRFNKRVTSVDISNNGIAPTSAAISVLAKSLEGNKVLKKLNVSGNAFADDGSCTLIEAIKSCDTLEELGLSDTGCGAAAAKSLAMLLQRNRKLKTLDLGSNDIGPEGAQALSEALKLNDNLGVNTLETLILCRNKIGTSGAKSAAAIFEYGKSLTSLDVSYNEFGGQNESSSEVAASIAAAIKSNGALCSINLLGCDIGKGAEAIVAAAEHRSGEVRTLCGIDSAQTDFEKESLNAADAVLLSFDFQTGGALQRAHLHENTFDDASRKLLRKAARDHGIRVAMTTFEHTCRVLQHLVCVGPNQSDVFCLTRELDL